VIICDILSLKQGTPQQGPTCQKAEKTVDINLGTLSERPHNGGVDRFLIDTEKNHAIHIFGTTL
jgi:hypothetical protein